MSTTKYLVCGGPNIWKRKQTDCNLTTYDFFDPLFTYSLKHSFYVQVFKESANATSDEEGRQVVTESILKLFSGFEAFALPSPTSDDDVMQDISNSREKLNPKFLAGLKQFESLLKSKLAPKSSIHKGEKVTGEGKYLVVIFPYLFY